MDKLLALTAAVALLSLYGIVQTAGKAGLGAECAQVSTLDPRPRVLADAGVLREGDLLLELGGMRIRRFEDLERACDALPVGAAAHVRLLRNGTPMEVTTRLQAFYGPVYVTVQAVTTTLFLLLSLLVLLRRPDDRAARVFHLLGLSIAGIVAFTHGRYTTTPEALGYLVRALFPAATALGGSALLHFAALFPRPRPRALALSRPVVWIATVLAVAGAGTTLSATAFGVEALALHADLSVSASKALVAAAMLAASVLFLTAGRGLEAADRARLGWVFLGLITATVVFVFLWLLPRAVAVRGVGGALPEGLIVPSVPEEVLLLSIAFAGTCMAVGIVRHRLFDIDLILRRGTLYIVVFVLLLGLYFTGLYALLNVLGPLPPGGTAAAIAVTVALDLALFLPVRGLAQRTLNRWFFRVHYDYREAQRQFTGALARAVTVDDIARLLVAHGGMLIPAERMGCFRMRDGRLRLLSGAGFAMLVGRSLRVDADAMPGDFSLPLALSPEIEAGLPHVEADAHMFARWRIALVLPLRAENGDALGFLVLGPKRAGTRYTVEDVDLLRTACEQAALQMERIALAERLAVEHAVSTRLEELNRLKSLLVSGVSHDLRTPLTSIRLFAELLHGSSCAGDPESARHLEIIEGECARLARLIENVLDFANIEQGVKQYWPAPVELNDIAERTVDLHAYQARMAGAEIRLHLASRPCSIFADADAVTGALVNLLANALKYGRTAARDRTTDVIEVRVSHDQEHAWISVRDHGPGIPDADLARVFDAFYRGAAAGGGQGGVGLGLALVSHVMDAHGGTAESANAPDGGCIVTLTFPRR